LVIAANEATCIYVLPRVFSEFKKQFPNVQILVDRSYGSRVVEAVVENQADFGITQLPVTEKRVQVAKIHSDEIKMIVPTGHPLAGLERVEVSLLVGHPLLLPKTGTTRARLAIWLEPAEETTTISMELDSTEMIKRFVLAGLGIGFLAATHVQEELEKGTLVAVSLAPDPMVRQIGLIYRKDKALSKAALGFIEVALKNATAELTRALPRTQVAGRVGKASEN
jgi:DNA-binding transcriptional LysR family regulator